MKRQIRYLVYFLAAVFTAAFLAACSAGAEETSQEASPQQELTAVSESETGNARRTAGKDSAPLIDYVSHKTAEGASGTSSTADSSGEIRVLDEGVTMRETPLFSKASEYSDRLSVLAAGETVYVTCESFALWYAVADENGQQGYVYTGDIQLKKNGELQPTNAAEEAVKQKFALLREKLPEGKYWNHMGTDLPFGEGDPWSVTDEPCEHSIYGELYCNFYDGATLNLFPQYGYLCQCLGFASFLSDQVFGKDAPLHYFYDYDQLRVGDQIRLNEYEHSMVVAEKTDEYVKVAEVNADYEDCLISWSREISRYELDELSWDLEFITRYPVLRDEEGVLLSAEQVQEAESSYSLDGWAYEEEEFWYDDWDDEW